MAQAKLDVEALVDGQRVGAFNINLLVWSFLALAADGYEIAALGNAAPHLIREWHLAPGGMGPLLSASLFGILVGAPLFGFIGDRFGRKSAMLLSSLLFGAMTLAVVWSASPAELTWLRFAAGIGIGGLMPNAISLNSEMAPKRLRATLVILMFMGITLGGALPGFVAASLVPEHGWKTLFWVGGAAPLFTIIGLFFFLPESVKFLALRPSRARELVRTLRRMRPDAQIPDDATFEAPPARAEDSGLRPIFAGGLAAITPLLWLSFAATLMANFFLNSWMPVLFEAKGLSSEAAALVSSMYHLGAVLGGLVMSVMLGRWGFLAVAAMLGVGAPAMVCIAFLGPAPVPLGLLVAFVGFCILGAQFGNNAAAGLIYPTASRAKGVGLAFGAGRIGSILGPILGAAFIGMRAPLIGLLGVIAATLLLGALAALILVRLSHKRFGGLRLEA